MQAASLQQAISPGTRRPSTRRIRNNIIFTPLLLLLVGSSSLICIPAVAAQNDTVLEVDACLLFQLFTPSTDGSLPTVSSEVAIRWAATVLLAVDHVNSRNCTILGPGCEDLISPLGAQLKINPIIFDLEDFSPRLAAVAAVRCGQAGGQYMIGPTTSAQSDIGTQLASVSDQLLISAYATSPALSDKDLYPNFARTAYSDGSLANAVVLLFKELGWKQAALLHNRDLFGTGYADSFTRAMTDSGLQYKAISLGAIITEESVRTAVLDLKQSGIKVVCIVTFHQEFPKILRAARDILGNDYTKYTFFVGGTPVQEVLKDNEDTFAEEPELLTMMEGMLGISATLNAERAQKLKAPLVEYKSNVEDALRQGLARSKSIESSICRVDNATETAEEAQAALDAVKIAANVDAPLDIDGEIGDIYVLHSYDLAWALATALSATIEDSGKLEAPAGADIIPLIREERVPSFNGAVGNFQWDEGGNPSASSINVLFTSYSKRDGDGQAAVDPAATWSVANGVEFFEETPIVWADGSVYPDVPSDGSVKDMMYVYLGSGFGAAAFLVFLVFLYYRRQQAKKTNPLLGINVKKVIRQIHGDVHDMQGGELANYIPALSDGNPNHFAIAVCTVGGKIYSVGDDGVKFTIQSAAKPFMYAHLIQLQDAEYAKQKINVEPSGLAFNSDVLSADGRPFNPLVNQGAIACCSLSAQGEDRQARYEQLNEFMSLCAGAQLHVDRRCYEGESATGDQNRKIAEVLYQSGCVETEQDRDEGLEAYFMGCSTNVDVKELAIMGATIANKGKNPKTKTQVMDPDTAQSISSVMMSCGMYNGAGNWMMDVGLPAKSGVSGCLLAVVPGVCGIAVFSPPLNEHGNSVRGIQACTELSTGLNLHVLKKKGSSSKFGSKISGATSMAGGVGRRSSGSTGGSNSRGGRPANQRVKNSVVPILEQDEGYYIPASATSTPADSTRLVKVAENGKGADNV